MLTYSAKRLSHLLPFSKRFTEYCQNSYTYTKL